MSVQSAFKQFQKYAQKLGLKNTKQREIIVEEFLRINGHMRADEILEHVNKIDKRISLATVYRTLKLLQDCGLARTHQFKDGEAIFEPDLDDDMHHDHLICTSCESIIEFLNPEIERLQEEVAKAHQFQVAKHRMELYGFCFACQNSKK